MAIHLTSSGLEGMTYPNRTTSGTMGSCSVGAFTIFVPGSNEATAKLPSSGQYQVIFLTATTSTYPRYFIGNKHSGGATVEHATCYIRIS